MAMSKEAKENTAKHFQQLFEEELTDANLKSEHYDVYRNILNVVLESSGYAYLDENHLPPLTLEIISNLSYEEWAEMHYEETVAGEGFTMARQLDMHYLFNYVFSHGDYLGAEAHFEESLRDFTNENPTVESFVERLEEYYNVQDLKELMNTSDLDDVKQNAIAKAKEEGFKYPEKVSFSVENPRLSVSLEKYARDHVDEILDSSITTSDYIKAHFYEDMINDGLVDYNIHIKDDPEDEEE